MSSLSDTQHLDNAIAIIGMAGRFPGAADVDTFWQNLRAGVESISTFSDDQMRSAGFDDERILRDPRLVRRAGVIDGADLFDAAFFGYGGREAAVMDPQQRVFLECAWEAVEHAGYDPKHMAEAGGAAVGVFAGASLNRYLLHHLRKFPRAVEQLGELELLVGGDKDFLATRIAYKLDLRGPALTVQTACSTSLASVVTACQSLLSFGCDVALAGGVTIQVPMQQGYLPASGGTLAPDGVCRPFDSKAAGLVPGNGVGIVVLKRLADAIDAGDTIYAVIRGAAMNNDGAGKIGYTAPSVDGQAQVISMAQALAGVEPHTISYIEAHGTGTSLGDPVEVAGLAQAFGPGVPRGSVAIGSVKASIGHLDSAAGVAGLIKTTLALHHGQIPASLNFQEPNPKLELEKTPFFVNASLRPWERRNGTPRRAGVSSFGLGGTNTHVVMEEAPERPAGSPPSRAKHLLVLSARTPAALSAAKERLARHLETHEEQDLADVEWTLQAGRSAFDCRTFVVTDDRATAASRLRGNTPALTTSVSSDAVFLFPGQGSQHAGMTRGLYETEAAYREQVDRCCDILQPHLGLDLRSALFGDGENLDRTALAQPALFVTEYALAMLWKSWGVQPAAMVGHSIGEYVAACLAGVFGLEDALRLVATRGRLMQSMPAGSMLAVESAADVVRTTLPAGLEIAVINDAKSCVVAGDADAVERYAAQLQWGGISSRLLRTSHAFHSASMEGMLAPFEAALRTVKLNRPTIPIISNLTGTWLTAHQATDPAYWTQHLRRPVQFHACLVALLDRPNRALLEVGPGTTLTTLAMRHEKRADMNVAIASCRHPKQQADDVESLLRAAGTLWAAGVGIDWRAFHGGARRRRVALPTYPFERKRHWLSDLLAATPNDAESTSSPAPESPRGSDLSEQFYLPSWRQNEYAVEFAALRAKPMRWVILGASDEALPARLRELDQHVMVVQKDHDLRAALGGSSSPTPPQVIVDLLDPGSGDVVADAVASTNHALNVAQTIDRGRIRSIKWMLLSRAGGQRSAAVAAAAAVGAARVAAREVAGLRVRGVEVAADATGWIDRLLAEALIDADEPQVAYRGRQRFVREVQAVQLESPTTPPRGIVDGGCYVITGGLGGIGLAIAEALAARHRAKLVLVGRSALPPREQWDILGYDLDARTRQRIGAVRRIEHAGGEVVVDAGDISDAGVAGRIFRNAVNRFGRIDGIIHAAGVAPGGAIAFKDAASIPPVLAPKVGGAAAIDQAIRELNLKPAFIAYCSSLAAVIGVPGQIDYSAANAALDAMAESSADQPDRRGADAPRVLSINWDTWAEVGMAKDAAKAPTIREHDDALTHGLTTAEGVEAFFRALATPWPQVLISTRPLAPRLKLMSVTPAPASTSVREQAGVAALSTARRPEATTPGGRIAAVWREMLGVSEPQPEDDFFTLGGHSLLAVQMAHRLQEEFGIELGPDVVMHSPTLAGLIESIGQLQEKPTSSGAAPAIVAVSRSARTVRRSTGSAGPAGRE